MLICCLVRPRKVMAIFMRFVLLLLVYSTLTLLVSAQNQSGFISLDCGLPGNSPNYTEETTGIIYTSDADYTDTGSSYSVPDEYVNNKQRQMWHVRSFPEGKRNCYRLNLTSGGKYLIRGSFLYGNYDRLNKLPQFDLYVGPNFWETVIISNASTSILPEIIHVVASNYLHVCLVNTGSGTPFISALELRPLRSTAYVTQTGSLEKSLRLDMGSTSGKTIRYKEDVYDRVWTPYYFNMWSNLSTSLTVDANVSNAYQPAPIVMETAVKPTNESMPLNFYLEPDNPNSQFYVYMHFAELEELKANETRQFNITLNGELWYGPFSPDYLETTTVFSKKALTGGTYNFSIIRTRNSTHPPIINAIEVYTVVKLLQSQTDQQDVDAITNIKLVYELKKDWEGDPCAPQAFLWEGLNCSYGGTDGPPRITSLNLSSSGLTGNITNYLSNLTMITSLDLSDNNLGGPVPESLAQLTSLKFLNLERNNLSGSIPAQLIEKSNNKLLTLRLEGNPELCLTVSCENTKEKNNIVIPVATSAAVAFILLAALISWWSFKRRKHKGKRVDTRSIPSFESFEGNNRQFSYSDVLKMTNNFERVLGKGGFGTVYHGYIDNDIQVAVKMLSPSSVQGYKQFQAEVKLLLRVHHRNLTTLAGYCEEGTNMALIYEFMANGNLEEHLSDSSKDVLNWEKRLQIAVEAAQGLEYLHHGCKPPIVHRDVKCTNILLNDKFEGKLADFGLSRTFPVEGVSHVSTIIAGTPGYLDPEYYISNRLTEKSDVYSFGVVLLEIITGRPVISKTLENDNVHISHWISFMLAKGDIRSTVDPRLKGDFDINSVWKAVEIAMTCVSSTSVRRPTMNAVVMEVKECLAMETARKRKDSSDLESNDYAETMTLNINEEFSPLAR
ncbi:LRR receptor-like serine/threonine-protein kinase IOS1 [Mangifera indica]|uniref:LRR receptor-like serine/threonine-protein kinase IOS1 n=1 Tax=Mangifera indica TaxID=29780 RepID=UPI001CFB32E2|nr:LRR receptor-like serine/threonine-protein kinase IOS1 [Mangifera indica]